MGPRTRDHAIRIQYLAMKRARLLGLMLFSSIMLPSAVEIAFSDTVTKSPFFTMFFIAWINCLI